MKLMIAHGLLAYRGYSSGTGDMNGATLLNIASAF